MQRGVSQNYKPCCIDSGPCCSGTNLQMSIIYIYLIAKRLRVKMKPNIYLGNVCPLSLSVRHEIWGHIHFTK